MGLLTHETGNFVMSACRAAAVAFGVSNSMVLACVNGTRRLKSGHKLFFVSE